MATAEDLNHSLSWPETLDRLRDFPGRLLGSIHGIPEVELGKPERRAAEGGGTPVAGPAVGGAPLRWSILNVIAHLGDLELMTAVRMRSMLARDERRLVGMDQERFVSVIHAQDCLADLVEQLGFHRRMNLALAVRLSEDELALEGEHPEFGTLTIRQVLSRVQRHQERHLRQIEAIKSSLALRASETLDVSGVVSAHGDSARVRDISPGIRVLDLWRNGPRAAMQVEIDAGAVWPHLDYHVPGPEEVYVVSGDFGDGVNTYPAGSFVHHPAGSSHVPQSREGCTLFVFYPEG